MKTVDSVQKTFKLRFSGLTNEDWVGHVNELELQCARKHCWSARQFFYALRSTIEGAALQTWVALERDEDQPDLGSFLPDWFECEAKEYRDLLKNRTSFSRMAERTQLAIIFVYFFYRFQRDTPRSALDDFLYAVQDTSENVELWGYRLERLATRVISFGLSLSFDDYLDQWCTGTRDTFFLSKLEEALSADDPMKPPVVFDYPSFKTWYARYVNKLVDRRKQLAKKSRLMTLNKMHKSSLHKPKEGGDKAGRKSISLLERVSAKTRKPVSQPNKGRGTTPLPKTPAPADLARRGPAPALNNNQHSNLWRPNANSLKNKRCYNCDEFGHLAKDCSKPKRPRNQRPRWRDRVQSLVSELYSSKPEPDSPGVDEDALVQHWQETVGAFLSSVQVEDDPVSNTQSPQSMDPTEGADQKGDKGGQLGNASAELFDADTAYHAYHLGGVAGRLLSAQSRVSSSPGEVPDGSSLSQSRYPVEPSFSMMELWHHSWPDPILRWVAHCGRAIIPSLHKIKRREGHTQCDISERTLSLIILSVSWLRAFLSSPLPQSFLELFEIAQVSEERASDAVTAHLGEVVRLEGASETRTATELYTSMISSFRELATDQFGQTILHLYHIEDESHDSDPSTTDARWSIPGPGEDFPVSLARRSPHGDPDPVDGPEYWSQREDVRVRIARRPPHWIPGKGAESRPPPGAPPSRPDSSESALRPTSIPEAVTGLPAQVEGPGGLDPFSAVDGASAGVTPTKGLEEMSGDSSSAESVLPVTFTVLKVKNDPFRGEHRYVIWADQVPGSKGKGVRAVKYTTQLHVAKNHVRQGHKESGGVTVRLPSDLVLFDPRGVTSDADTKSLKVFRDVALTYTDWLDGLDSKETRSTRVRPVPRSIDERKCEDGKREVPPTTVPEEVATPSNDQPDTEGPSEHSDLAMAPYRLEAPKSKKKKASTAEKPVQELLKATKKLGIFLDVWLGGEPTPTSWMFDPGCEVSQISWAIAQAVWSFITPLGSARLRCTMATSTAVSDLQLVKIGPFRLTDFDHPEVISQEFWIEALINPSLKVHPCVLGLNTICQLRILADFCTQSIRCMGSTQVFPLRAQAGTSTSHKSSHSVPKEAITASAVAASSTAEDKDKGGPPPGVPSRSRVVAPASGRRAESGPVRTPSSDEPSRGKASGVKSFTDRKRQQLTLRQSWTLKRFVTQKKEAERYSPADRRGVDRAVHKMKSMEEDEEQLLHRLAMSSISAVEVDNSKDEPILVSSDSSGEDSVLGITSRPRPPNQVCDRNKNVEAWFSDSESMDGSSQLTPKGKSGRPSEEPDPSLNESSGFLRVKEAFDSPVGVSPIPVAVPIPTARLVVDEPKRSHPRPSKKKKGKRRKRKGPKRRRRCSHYAIADTFTWGVYQDWDVVQRLRPRHHRGFMSLHEAREWLEEQSRSRVDNESNGPKPYFSVHGGPNAGVYRNYGAAQRATSNGRGIIARLDTLEEAASFLQTGITPPPFFKLHLMPNTSRNDSTTENIDIGGGMSLTPSEVQRLFDSDVETPPPTPDPGGQPSTLFSAPSEFRIRVETEACLSGTPSKISTAVREASELGSYIPIAIGDHCVLALYDSGASITQVSPEFLKLLLPYLEELDTDQVHFVSAENKSLQRMRLFGCKAMSLVQVESGVRSSPCYTLLVENPLLKSFPVLFGLRSMCDLGLTTDHRHGLVRDSEGRPFRLYSPSSRNAVVPSLTLLSKKWKGEALRTVPRGPAPPIPVRRTPPWQVVRRRGPTPTLKPNSHHRSARVPQPEEGNQNSVSSAESISTVRTSPGATAPSPRSLRTPRSEELPYVSPEPDPVRDSSSRSLSEPPLPLSTKTSSGKAMGGSRSPVDGSGGRWHPSVLLGAEESGDVAVFERLTTRHIHPLQRYLLRHAERTGSALPRFSAYLQAQGEKDPGFKSRWNNLWEQHARWIHKPSKRRPTYPVDTQPAVASMPSPLSMGIDGGPPSLPEALATDSQEQSSFIPRKTATKPWVMDPTPPHLTTPFPKVGDSFPDEPVHLHPDFQEALEHKATERWSRGFSMWSQSKRTRLLSGDKWYRRHVLGDKGRGAGHSILIIPPKKEVDHVLKTLLDLRKMNAHTSALLLLPEDYPLSTEAKTFLHAYCQQGEVYRYGGLFSRSRDGPTLHLNQCVTEYWFDGEGIALASLRPSQRKELEELLQEFQDCIGDEFNRANQPKHVPYVRLPVKAGFTPASESPFKKNPRMTQITIDFVRELERKGLISRCTNNEAQFVCNSLNIPKSDERYRFVCTFSDLNKNLIKDPYGMRTLDEVMAALEGCTWFTTIDLVDGFFSLPLYPADRGFTAFHTPLGLYKWEVLPQGTSASPAIFQRMMDRWFSAFLWKNVLVWIDDILVYSRSFKDHLKALRGVFQVLRRYGLVASKRKLVLCMRSVKYLGFIFGVKGIRADPDKLAAVHRIPSPSGRKQVRQFLGFANFYRRFLPPDFSTIIAPLTALTSEKNPFVWDSACQAAFNQVKLLLTSTPVLVHPDFSKPFHIHCDASGKGVGAVLSQFVDGAYRPIAFCSKKLLPHQQHWSPAQLEAYAVYHSVVVKWRYYLALSKTVIHSDHRNLIWLMQHQHKGMIGRWYTSLTAFDLDISYVSGKSQMVADPLSRLFKEVKRGTYRPESNPALAGDLSGAAVSLSALAHTPPGGYRTNPITSCGRRWCIGAAMDEPSTLRAVPTKLEALEVRVSEQFSSPLSAKNLSPSVWASHQRDDPFLGQVYKFLSTRATGDIASIPSKIRAQARSYRLQGNLLFYRNIREVGVYDLDEGWALAVPASLRDKVIAECHGDGAAGHGGIRKTTLLLRQRYHFRNMRKAVAEFIRRCVSCRRAKTRILSLVTPLTPMVSYSPFNAVAIDLYQPGSITPDGFRYVLTVVDLCTKWCMFFPLKTKYPAEVMAVFLQQWCHLHGLPQFVLSDRGKEFQGVASTVCEVLQVKQIRTTPYHPRTNGLCESQHKMLTYELKIRSSRKDAPEWDRLLTEINFCHNITPIESSGGYSPFQLVYGRNPRLSAKDVCFPGGEQPPPIPAVSKHRAYVQALQDRLSGMQFAARESAVESKQLLRDQHEERRQKAGPSLPAQGLRVGDIVCVYQPKPILPKLSFQWSEPDHIVIDVRPNTCAIRSLRAMGGAGVSKMVSKIRKAGGLPSRRINNKLLSSYPVPDSFFLGAQVCRKFGSSWYVGVVDQTFMDEGEPVWKVTYSDFDSEEVDKQKLASMLVHHSLLDTQSDVRVPILGSFVWFSEDQRPRLGQVKEIDPSVSRPVTVHLYTPLPGASDITRARFQTALDPESKQPILKQLTMPQVILQVPRLSAQGYLLPKDRNALAGRILR